MPHHKIVLVLHYETVMWISVVVFSPHVSGLDYIILT